MKKTRDELRAVIRDLWKQPKTNNSSADFYIDMFVKFGALEIEEPLPPVQRLHDALSHTSLATRFTDIVDYIDGAGLKLVDK